MPNRDEKAIDPLAGEQDDATDAELIDAAEDEDDEEFEEDEDEDDEDLVDEEADDESGPTAEVGSEGGSPGDAVPRNRSRVTTAAGSEASETWRPSDAGESTTELRDDDVLVKRAP